MKYAFGALAAFAAIRSSAGQSVLRTDNGTAGPPLEEVHYYYSQWPTGVAVSSTGRIFTTYLRGGNQYQFTLGEVVNTTAEQAYPSQSANLPPDQLTFQANNITFGSSDANAFISVQSVVITSGGSGGNSSETLWVLDTGRPSLEATSPEYGFTSFAYGTPGGPKLSAIDLSSNTTTRTYTFGSDVVYPDSYLNEVRVDLKNNVAYIADSSSEGRTGFVVVDLKSGLAWRHLERVPSTASIWSFVPTYQSLVFYVRPPMSQLQKQSDGINGIQYSADGQTMYYSSLSNRYLYSIPTQALINHTLPLSEQAAQNAILTLGQKGGTGTGFEGDSNGLIYFGSPEHNAIKVYDPSTLQASVFVRDPRIIFPDSLAVTPDGYLYFTVNQIPYQPLYNDGVDLRVPPGALLRVKLPNGGAKIEL